MLTAVVSDLQLTVAHVARASYGHSFCLAIHFIIIFILIAGVFIAIEFFDSLNGLPIHATVF